MEEAREFAQAIHAKFPGKLLAYNCSPSFNWKRHLTDDQIASFQKVFFPTWCITPYANALQQIKLMGSMQDLGALGYKYQFVTLAGFHSLNHGMFELAGAYNNRGMAAYAELQQAEIASEKAGYTATKHQREVRIMKLILLFVM